MSRHERSWISQRIRSRAAQQWTSLLDSVQRRRRQVPEGLRDEARDLRQVLGRFLQATDEFAPGIRDSLHRMELPDGTDWRWRPNIMQTRISDAELIAPRGDLWLSEEVALFHDCEARALMLKQVRNRLATDLAGYGLRLEVMGFSGSFLSFSLTLPPEALADLGGHHIVRLHSVLQAERPITVYARLNIQQGPNTETVLRQMGDPIDGANCQRLVEFDLGYADLSQRSVHKAWIDLIFEAPYMNAVALRDVVLSRHPRAQI
ncbi:DUF6478 family protein [Paracoccus sp. 1_MG-2023]|uniref:DUF6478 family protein n=1 Tax=unclassified Paracoccus (in: a-proteobacteria) TaxID=2688777 RepID=UPI001C0A251E|nr:MULTISPECIES: DUF6478 family protein [unclassified Paracoccus (in: a-proteobacteria)]MBU2956315.1 hypothetical protein [Paracoccus sp. C2R09]MDO6667991.1 DUF6478 family protein [Paracoccus sp. 1_MG-2023]